MGGPPKLKTVELPRQKYPEACVWQPTSNLLVFFVEYTFIGIWVLRPRDVYAMAFNGLRVRVMIGDLSDADATSIAVGRIKVLAREGFGPGDKEGVCRDIWARLQSLESELRATLDNSVAGEG